MGILDSKINRNLNQNESTIVIKKEDVIKELKEILKSYKPIGIGVAYDTDNEEIDKFIEFCPEKKQIYLVEGFNPYTDNYNLNNDGEIISLSKVKEIIDIVAKLTLEKNIKNKELIDWLNE